MGVVARAHEEEHAMLLRNLRTVAVLALLMSPAAALAGPSSGSSMSIASESMLALPASTAFAAPSLLAHAPACDVRVRTVRYESIRYRPRHRSRPPENEYRSERDRTTGFSQLHGGFVDPDGDLSANMVFGFRGGLSLDSHIQLGLGVDWAHRSDKQSQLVTQVPLPGGGTADRRLDLAQSSADLIPMMGVLQISPGDNLPVAPYFGVGGGYEVLFVSAEDFTTGEQFDATYGGWGWQAWAGVSMPLSGRTRLNAEVFRNTAQVGRDVTTAEGVFRETVDVDGTGGRFALSWGF
jgi:hypothetical protein